jgi:sulfate adenylyltransferase
MPVTLDVSQVDVDRLSLTKDKRVALRDPRDGEALAILTSETSTTSTELSNR